MGQQTSRRSIWWGGIALLALVGLATVRAQAQPVLTVSGQVTKPLTLQAADLKAMPHSDVSAKDKDGATHRYSGVSLFDLLKQAGTTLGGELRGKNLTKYVLVKAGDGYEVVFALPELDPEFASRVILLADSVDGKPLAPGIGPYRVIVPDEKKPARWIRDVKSIEVKAAN
ncbi:molybdopterin-dependent oxidoreductase [Spirosoma linguale]|uniref:Oxidoreductase molybdopterin binding protein n=1 Tax=Spirosoma linguale (strain ATCC 33905 / DSM 74 / LMG 10896 / Claus 1) TaxID=504472 RepID=D2QFJ2_SPILD|nr:oxidoreductase molybdopterin binding protein [Spirosoma linguale DSM 74]